MLVERVVIYVRGLCRWSRTRHLETMATHGGVFLNIGTDSEGHIEVEGVTKYTTLYSSRGKLVMRGDGENCESVCIKVT